MRNKVFNFITILFFMGVIGTSLSAQISNKNKDLAELFISSDLDIVFSSTENENVYYLDLEKVEGHLLDASVMEGIDVVEQMNLIEVRKDAFYEMNLNDLEKGNYKLRIRTFKKEYEFAIQVD